MPELPKPDDAPRDLPLLAFDVRGQALGDAPVQFCGQWQAQAGCYDLHLTAFGHAAALTSDTLADEQAAAARQAEGAAHASVLDLGQRPALAAHPSAPASPATGVLSTASPWPWAWGAAVQVQLFTADAVDAPIQRLCEAQLTQEGFASSSDAATRAEFALNRAHWDAELLLAPRGKSPKAKAARVLRVPLTAASWAAYRAAQSAVGRAGGAARTSLDAAATPGDPSSPEAQP